MHRAHDARHGSMKYTMISLLLFAVSVGLLWRHPGRRTALWLAVASFLYAVLCITRAAMTHFTAQGLTEAVVFTLLHDVGNAGVGGYWKLIVACTLGLLLVGALSYGVYRLVRRHPPRRSAWWRLAWMPMVGAVVLNPLTQDAYGLARFYAGTGASTEFDKYYLPYTKAGEAAQVRNLVYIYAESLERNYFDERLFPGLMPNLKALRAEALDFSELVQVPGSEFTIGGMVASQCGTPLFAVHHGNTSSGLDTFMPGATCAGSVLRDSGFDLTFMQGASLTFSGKGNFYNTHGFQHIYGRENLATLGGDAATPLNVWGYYDDFLLDRAFERYQALSAAGQRFGLFLLTLDTHHYDGFLSPRCLREGVRYGDGRNSMLNAVACSDRLLGEFVRKVRAAPGGRDTVIVIASDHLAMNNPVYKQLETYPRKELFMVLDPGQPGGRQIDTPGTVLDAGVTALNLLGLDVSYGLGRDILRKPSLAEGRSDFDGDLSSWRDSILAFWGHRYLGREIMVDLKDQKIGFGGQSMRFPVILQVTGRGEATPRFDFDVEEEFELVDFLQEIRDEDKFVWIDRCDHMMLAWQAPRSDGYCSAVGRLGGEVAVRPIDASGPLPIDWPRDAAVHAETAAQVRSRLASRRYPSTLDEGYRVGRYGMPDFLKEVSGLSAWAPGGRWTDANLAPSVRLVFAEPLPAQFDVEIDAYAYGANADAPVRLRAGNVEREAPFSGKGSVSKVTFRGVRQTDTLEIIPPHPQRPVDVGENEDTRQLGLFLKFVKVSEVHPVTALR